MQLTLVLRDQSYHDLDKIGDKQRKVLEVIQRYPNCSDRVIANVLGWDINRVTGRRNELMKLGMITHSGCTLDSSTNRTVSTWKIKSESI